MLQRTLRNLKTCHSLRRSTLRKFSYPPREDISRNSARCMASRCYIARQATAVDEMVVSPNRSRASTPSRSPHTRFERFLLGPARPFLYRSTLNHSPSLRLDENNSVGVSRTAWNILSLSVIETKDSDGVTRSPVHATFRQ